MVGGRVWGVISTSSSDAPLPDRVEDGIAAFTELVATAIANSQARDELTRLAEEQAALRRVATLVAEGASPDMVFDAVCAEVAQLVPADAAALTRYEDDGTLAVLGGRTLPATTTSGGDSRPKEPSPGWSPRRAGLAGSAMPNSPAQPPLLLPARWLGLVGGGADHR